jgi:hypothetical protein
VQNKVQTYLEPRGLAFLFDKLRDSELAYAITASFASVDLAPIVQPETLVAFVRDPAAAASRLGLRLAEAGANVILAEPFDPVVFERTRAKDGLIYAGASQVAADLLKGPGRNPAEAEALIDWMADNEAKWRIPIPTS